MKGYKLHTYNQTSNNNIVNYRLLITHMPYVPYQFHHKKSQITAQKSLSLSDQFQNL